MKSFFIIVLLFINPAMMMGQLFSTKGQFWSSGLIGNDPPPNQSSFESTLGYIPTLSLSHDLTDNQFIDIEWAYHLDRNYSGDSLLNHNEDPHRLWVRFSGEKVELRLGLQKIVFGPSQLLRTLSWFDNIDLKDPTGQTDGVEAFRLRWFPSNTLSVWSWAIQNDHDTLSFGGRTELSTNYGEWGFTFHQDPSEAQQQIGQMGAYLSRPHKRIALDYRYDGFIGSWMESGYIFSEDSEIELLTVGADYTLPIASGILILTEFLYIDQKQNGVSSSQTYSAFMANMPIGMIHQIMFISQIDWKDNRAYNYFRWSATYDQFSLNFILSVSPKRADYNNLEEHLPETAAGFGTGLQFMFIYNH